MLRLCLVLEEHNGSIDGHGIPLPLANVHIYAVQHTAERAVVELLENSRRNRRTFLYNTDREILRRTMVWEASTVLKDRL